MRKTADKAKQPTQKPKRVTRKVLVLDLDTPTTNGRVYPAAVMEKAVTEYGKHVAEGRTFGCLWSKDDAENRPELRLADVSHVIKSVAVEGQSVVAVIEVLKTPKGAELKKLLLSNRAVFFTSGIGTVVERTDGTKLITDFTLTGIDIIEKQK
jgi:hypothetical protein